MFKLNASQSLCRFRGDLAAERMSDAGIVNELQGQSGRNLQADDVRDSIHDMAFSV